jgi:hypothetical protein
MSNMAGKAAKVAVETSGSERDTITQYCATTDRWSLENHFSDQHSAIQQFNVPRARSDFSSAIKARSVAPDRQNGEHNDCMPPGPL